MSFFFRWKEIKDFWEKLSSTSPCSDFNGNQMGWRSKCQF